MIMNRKGVLFDLSALLPTFHGLYVPIIRSLRSRTELPDTDCLALFWVMKPPGYIEGMGSGQRIRRIRSSVRSDRSSISIRIRIDQQTDVPVIQLSLDDRKSKLQNIYKFEKISNDKKRVLIVGSGNLVHNLGIVYGIN